MEESIMAFKTAKSYNEERYGGFFILRNDGEYADVIFLYQNVEDVLVADVHYIKSNSYSGYAHCCGKGCPACQKGIRTQTKLFIPVYNIMTNQIEFFDRTMKFEPQLQQDVFSRYPNPSEFVFRITRHGAAGSMDTTYEVVAIGKNSTKSYSQILVENNATMPEYYNTICRELTPSEMQNLLNDNTTSGYSSNEEYAGFTATPRGAATPQASPQMPAHDPIDVPTYSAPPEYVPPVDSVDDSDSADNTVASEEEADEPTF